MIIPLVIYEDSVISKLSIKRLLDWRKFVLSAELQAFNIILHCLLQHGGEYFTTFNLRDIRILLHFYKLIDSKRCNLVNFS